ncbi:aminotransferase class V-fold PLP-dependent enzyme [Cytobacillus sp. IB215316]|uniref:aminotransferase class V-fold PLP-dependent enzyme n=1 Tax=Cytobacillus sp. IB215316 TaxID=3097354 RepID=UPI002A136E55|nr:aminotransferase class V-fold PLP-dependent enzyme [Cytobacillus sp. IB215316]MDX8360933.1 aminotransferase class V-fold PLP-dependent enzyme [Cytobacillus sp. IB215316]
MGYIYKVAKNADELNQIHSLNYETFVEEIPQHGSNKSKELVDQFHDENTYLICKHRDEVIGMVALRHNRPFSLDKKIGKIEGQLPVNAYFPCEIRLLAVKKEYRNGRVFVGIAQLLARYCLKKGYDLAVISGTTRRAKLYAQLGFQPFSQLVGKEDAYFQPMYLTRDTFEESVAGRLMPTMKSFLPGPVSIRDEVTEALNEKPISHRSTEFHKLLSKVKGKLCNLTNAMNVQLLMGTGTLANDMIAMQLKLNRGKGLILVNGEFGNRLVDHANRCGLQFDMIEKTWGEPFCSEEIKRKIHQSEYSWLWAVHCETSTGMINDIDGLKELSTTHNIRLCLDCISTVGIIPVDLEDVFLASGVSGKGLGAYTGISFVYHNKSIKSSPLIPKYLDLGIYIENEGVAFSYSSNLLHALHTALDSYETLEKFTHIRKQYSFIRSEVEGIGLKILVDEEFSSPGIMTIVVPSHLLSTDIGDELYIQGYYLHYESSYLKANNWLQIACMNRYDDQDIENMIKHLKNGIGHINHCV